MQCPGLSNRTWRRKMKATRTHNLWRLGRTGFLALAMILTACGPTPTTAPPPTNTPVPPVATSAPPAATPLPPTATSVPATATRAPQPQIVIAYDSDIDHIEPMQFRSLGGYDATANLYEPLITQKLVPNETGELIGM